MTTKHYIGETPKLIITLSEDLSSITTHSWYIKKPDGDIFTLTGADVAIDNAATGVVSTVVDKTDWDVAGFYKIHVYIMFADNTEFYSTIVEHEVRELYT